jgi:AI-2 transport protein TqsA
MEINKNLNSIQFILFFFLTFLVFFLFSYAQSILIPTILALVLSIILAPVVHFLQRFRIPISLAALISILVSMLIIVSLSSIVIVSLNSLNESIPDYSLKFRNLAQIINVFLKRYDTSITEWLPHLQTVASNFVGAFLTVTMTIVKNSLLIFMITFFMLIEATRFSEKARKIFGDGNFYSYSFKIIGKDIQRYLLFKTLISLLTGFLVWLALLVLGVDFPLVWALIAFILNFIPNIGSIAATAPPVILSFLQFEGSIRMVLLVLLILGSIQMFIGNYLEPKLMGSHLNLSPLIVFMSMIFWGWMWGPTGMLLATPLTVCLKVILDHHTKTRPFAQMIEG